MSDYWNGKGLYCVENCKNQGMPITAMYMKEIVQQRAELLDVLKDVMDSVDKGQCAMLNAVAERVRTTITKTEVAE